MTTTTTEKVVDTITKPHHPGRVGNRTIIDMWRILCVILCTTLSACVSNPKGTDETIRLQNQLDKLLQNSEVKHASQEYRIDSLQMLLSRTGDYPTQMNLYRQLYEETWLFDVDKAFESSRKFYHMAECHGDSTDIFEARVMLGTVLANRGDFVEFDSLCEHFCPSTLSEQQLAEYHLMRWNYGCSKLVFSNHLSESLKLTYACRDSFLLHATKQHPYYHAILSTTLQDNMNDSLLEVICNDLNSKELNSRQTAIEAFTIAEIFGQLRDYETEKKYLLLSAIADMNCKSRISGSIERLASLSMSQGDLDRAYSYYNSILQNELNTNMKPRVILTTRNMNSVRVAYNNKLQNQRQQLRIYLLVVILALFIISFVLFLVYKQRVKLSIARAELHRANAELEEINKNLSKLNLELADANHKKEEYIGMLFGTCSLYIEQLNSFRSSVAGKVITHKWDELRDMVDKDVLAKEQLRDFIRNFDEIFLRIYPNFIEELNTLLRPDEQIPALTSMSLTTDLRIHALVRLGFTDSQKIADFLHLSLRTVYNNRVAMRNKSIVPRDKFDEMLKSN